MTSTATKPATVANSRSRMPMASNPWFRVTTRASTYSPCVRTGSSVTLLSAAPTAVGSPEVPTTTASGSASGRADSVDHGTYTSADR
ncbi:hypothetical protein QE370_001248 [Aeromicrobium sp. SORGH_AS981]|uniref:hypothetical protein n=1 Tax=Aeromicrobium sp. SORGH_AS_0981 TaxID=3041802 RepID=UPI00285750FB|nr:hypothetical protein [Aeromicrobium sp. SORGH_AS_0981]MDR6118064.1 hypothetical protein [Aeromicrobium sp. SORGH_AS_0981]